MKRKVTFFIEVSYKNPVNALDVMYPHEESFSVWPWYLYWQIWWNSVLDLPLILYCKQKFLMMRLWKNYFVSDMILNLQWHCLRDGIGVINLLVMTWNKFIVQLPWFVRRNFRTRGITWNLTWPPYVQTDDDQKLIYF